LTAHGSLLGTADYLAPEQWDQPHTADIRADIYSLGCTLFHLLTGHAPFTGAAHRTIMSKMRAHADHTPPALFEIDPTIPPELETIVNRMLAKDPAQRFATPAEVATALEPLAVGSNLT